MATVTPRWSCTSSSGQIATLVKWIVLAVAIIVLISLFVFGRSIFTDWLWFDNLGYRGIFVKVLTTRITLFLIGAAAMAVLSGISNLHSKPSIQGQGITASA